MAVYEGTLNPAGIRLAVVVARYNRPVTAALLAGAQDALRRQGVPAEAVDVVWVPGSFELPVTARRLAASGRYHAIVALGAVLKGETAHFEYVAGAAAQGLLQAGLSTGVPVIFGVLTCETLEQALDRTGLRAGDRGAEAALAALEMANLFRTLPD
ncbi:6,7-dimethyl-8-ribityllumazine synthase [Thermaerobacter marianensis DSM 12885]|uniref:6,7-dimethyl-8-ribityllumazine synthase n=1 Tax=Thermaerobacter marianensis (strain ATCC 700841 / DSM 12885 / JCM 10246 / 7p75a) TaxID=644966 RepID=E6SJ48_THEM7|nr:6,7-dimethyl-8-ribityllumazine synthase [Thermaerobacter marianensis]ADU52072.1 6,7-dimethyl-8-ribityllumazine synthase [Thermaerobacter marianensis DSM 12885]